MSNAARGGMLVPKATQMETVSGRFVDTLHPDPATIVPSDIAHHLSQLSRYGGATSRTYSVAEHVVLVHDLLVHQGENDRERRLAALLHDGAEYVLQDLISPVKFAVRMEELAARGCSPASPEEIYGFRGAYGRLSDRMDKAIATRFGVPVALFDDPAIKLADMWALRIEARELTYSKGANWRWSGELPEGGDLPAEVEWAGGLDEEPARRLFLDRLGESFEETGPAALTARSRSDAVSEQPPGGASPSPRVAAGVAE